MKKFWFLLVAILVLSLGLIAAGCPATDDNGNGTEAEEHDDDHGDEDEHDDDSDEATDSDADTAGGPSISITSPEDGTEVAGPDVEVTTEVVAFEVVNKPDQEAADGEGHIHWNVDGGGDTPTYEAEFTITDLGAGEHTIQAKLHNNDHDPYEGTDTAEVTITVTE